MSRGKPAAAPRFDAAAAIVLMRDEGATLFFGVPTMFVQLLEASSRATALPNLHDCISGGASLPVAVLQRIELFRDGRLGEIVIRGHNVFAGYLDNPEASAQALVDGWFRTGDIGQKHADGFVTIVDRKKALIIRGGFNVYPREVEEVLMRHPAIAQVALIGVPDVQRCEEVCAVVVPNEGECLDGEALVHWARERLGVHKYPRRIEVVDALPMGPSRKVLKRELRAQLANNKEA